MSVLRITRFHIDPADTGEMIARRATLIEAVRAGYPGLAEARLSKVDDETWVDIWRWDSRALADTALAAAPALPEAAAAFAVTRDATAEFAEVVGER
jgi:hypothetical protein